MMGFKEQLFKDIKTVFLNPAEFGEMHTVDGRQLCCIVDNMEIIEREKKSLREYTDGVFKRQLLFYVARSDFGKLPAVGRTLEFDGKKYRVEDAVEEGAVYSITLEVITS